MNNTNTNTTTTADHRYHQQHDSQTVSAGEKKKYAHRLPPSRLGTRHKSLESYLSAIISGANHQNVNERKRRQLKHVDAGACCATVKSPPTEFSLVVILSSNNDLIRSTSREENDDYDDTENHRNEIDDNDGANGSSSSSSSNISILLGKKLRGFGSGFYNCFGGKLEASLHEYTHPAKGAVRELEEECGIQVSLEDMEKSFVGKIHFSFEDDDVNKDMLVHLFCVFISLDVQSTTSQHGTITTNGTENDDVHNMGYHSEGQKNSQSTASPYYHASATIVSTNQIRGCDEIEPCWFHNIHGIPLRNMFADDSIWLTMLLDHYNEWFGSPTLPRSPPPKVKFDARFHFHAGGAETNSIMHYFIQIKSSSSLLPKRETDREFSLEQRLFHALHSNNIHSPSIKEFRENWAMANAVRSFMKDDESRMEYVLDVAGGHGALAALFLLLVPACRTAVVIDPAECNSGKYGVREAWSGFWSTEKELRYRHECLRTGLRKELDSLLRQSKNTNVTIVACHACQHLTDETLQIASEYGVNVAVMPCCQKDHDGWWKNVAKGLVTNDGGGRGNGDRHGSLSIGALLDVLAAGKMMSWNAGLNSGVRYSVKMKLIDESISRQNRIILCKALERDVDATCDERGERGMKEKRKEMAHARLTRAYDRAHRLPTTGGPSKVTKVPPALRDCNMTLMGGWCLRSLLAGICVGTIVSLSVTSFVKKK